MREEKLERKMLRELFLLPSFIDFLGFCSVRGLSAGKRGRGKRGFRNEGEEEQLSESRGEEGRTNEKKSLPILFFLFLVPFLLQKPCASCVASRLSPQCCCSSPWQPAPLPLRRNKTKRATAPLCRRGRQSLAGMPSTSTRLLPTAAPSKLSPIARAMPTGPSRSADRGGRAGRPMSRG